MKIYFVGFKTFFSGYSCLCKFTTTLKNNRNVNRIKHFHLKCTIYTKYLSLIVKFVALIFSLQTNPR